MNVRQICEYLLRSAVMVLFVATTIASAHDIYYYVTGADNVAVAGTGGLPAMSLPRAATIGAPALRAAPRSGAEVDQLTHRRG